MNIPQVCGNDNADELINVTQKWCDDMQIGANKLAKNLHNIKRIASLNVVKESNIVDAIDELLGSFKKY